MARSNTAQRRVSSRTGKTGVQSSTIADSHFYGNAVVSREVARNRRKAKSMSRGYCLFLAVITVATVLMCVQYLQLKETITAQNTVRESLETQLMSLRSENDALYENVMNNVDWEYIRDVAINKLGMKYAAEDQVVWYNTEDDYYVRQYRDVTSDAG